MESEQETFVEHEGSEFGAGIVVCLAKFSEHLDNHWIERFQTALWWIKADESEREENRLHALGFPQGDSALRLMHVQSVFLFPEKNHERALLDALRNWANGASDHFYDLDREKAPQELIDLGDYMLELGHGSGLLGKWPHSAELTWKQILEMWEAACLAVDRMIGVEPDWGAW